MDYSYLLATLKNAAMHMLTERIEYSTPAVGGCHNNKLAGKRLEGYINIYVFHCD